MIFLKTLKTKTVLIVEDEEIVRKNLSSTLKFFFKEVFTAIDGYDGLDKFQKHLPDFLITDLKMPNMNGFELILELKKRKFKPFTIIVSAHTDTDFLINAIHQGVDGYIIKPITEKALFTSFEKYMQTHNNDENLIKLDENLIYDNENSVIIKEEEKIHLNKKENKLLQLLTKDFSKNISYEEIEYQVWGSDSMSINALRSVVRDLRKKIGSEYIVNISGNGYSFSK